MRLAHEMLYFLATLAGVTLITLAVSDSGAFGAWCGCFAGCLIWYFFGKARLNFQIKDSKHEAAIHAFGEVSLWLMVPAFTYILTDSLKAYGWLHNEVWRLFRKDIEVSDFKATLCLWMALTVAALLSTFSLTQWKRHLE